jgi:hypothetical protein
MIVPAYRSCTPVSPLTVTTNTLREKLTDLGIFVLPRRWHDDIAIFQKDAAFRSFGC